jgi:HSP20 family molecular chaperone IbpA
MVFPGSPVNSLQSGQHQMMALWAALAPLQPLAPEPPPPQPLPCLELRETTDSCIVTVVVPGYDPACLEVQATANSLTVICRQLSDRAAPATIPFQQAVPFQQTLALPQPVWPNQLQVALQDKTLVVTLPKVKAAKRWLQGLPRSLRRSS